MSSFRFRLTNNKTSDSILLTGDNVPVGWDSRKPEIERDTLYHGAMTSFTVGLTFIADGFNFLENIYSTDGILGDVTIEFEEKNNQTKEWSIQDTGVIDFTTRNIVSTIRNGGVEYNVLDTGFKQKVRKREDVEISYNKSESLDGDTIPTKTYSDCEVLGIDIADTDINITMPSLNYSDNGDARNVIYSIETTYPNQNFRNVIARQYEGSELPNLVNISDCFYYSTANSKVKINFDIEYNVKSNQSFESIEHRIRLYKIDFNDAILNPTELDGETVFSTGIRNFTGEEEIDLTAGQALYFWAYKVAINALGNSVNAQSEILSAEIKVDFIETFKPTTSKVIFPYDVFQRLKESITGSTTAIDAEILEQPGGKYSNYAIMNGLLLRNFTKKESNLSFNLKKWYTEFDKIFNIGIDFSNDNFTIKDKKDFYTQDLIHTFDEKDVVADSLEKSLSLDYYYSDIEVGYTPRNNEKIGGLQEYNSKAYYNTVLSVVSEKLNITSELIGNAYTFEEVRRLQKTSTEGKDNETIDTNFDQNIFILDVVDDVVQYKQRTNEDISNIEGLPLVTTPINLSITPSRNLGRWGWMLLTGLQKFASDPVRFNKAEIKQQLDENDDPLNVSSEINGKTTTENTDIPFNEFDPPIFAGTLIDIGVVADLSIYKKIKENPFGLIGVWNEVENQYNYGWILKFSLGATDKDATMTLIEAKSVSFIAQSWLWESGEKILWESGEFMELDD